jgi:hypothetical protein
MPIKGLQTAHDLDIVLGATIPSLFLKRGLSENDRIIYLGIIPRNAHTAISGMSSYLGTED